MTSQSVSSTTTVDLPPPRSSAIIHSDTQRAGDGGSDLTKGAAQWQVFLGTMLAALLLNLIIYLPRTNAPFVFDSIDIIRNNPSLDEWQLSGSRWLAMASFALDRSLYGLDVRGYHATSIAVHLITTGLVFWTLFVVLGFGNWSTRISSARLPIAAFTALLWSVHPLQTQAVLYTVQRMETLMAMFFLASMLLFIAGLQAKYSVLYLLGSAACYFASASCKEVAIAIPPVLLIYDFMTSSGSSAVVRLVKIAKSRAWFYALLLLLSFAFAPTLQLIAERVRNVSFTDTAVTADSLQTSGTDAVDVAGVTPVDYLLTQPKVITRYLALAVFPRGQNIDHAVEISQSWYDRTIYPSVFALLGIAALIAIWKGWLVGFGIAPFLLVLAPTSSIIPIRDLMVEHRMYLPLVAVIGVICGGVFTAVRSRRLAITIAVAAALLLTGVSAARVTVYRSGVALWKDAIEKNPENSRAFSNLASSYYYESKKFKESIEAYERAIETATARVHIPTLANIEDMRRSLSEVQNNYAVLLTRNQNHSAAQRLLEKAVENDPQNAAAFSSLGNVYVHMGDKRRAIANYEAALRIDPNMTAAKRNLATVSASLRSNDTDPATESTTESTTESASRR